MIFSDLPSGWKSMPMKRCVVLRQNGSWGTDTDDDESGEYCLRAADFDYRNLAFNDVSTFARRQYDTQTFNRARLSSGDLVIEKSGGGEKVPVGRALLFEGDFRATFSNFLERQRVNQRICLPRYYWYWWTALYQTGITRQYINQTTGIQNLDSQKLLTDEYIALPPVDEQGQIVATLDSLLSASFSRQSLIEEQIDVLERYRKSLIHEAVTKGLDRSVPMRPSGIDWIGDVPEGWYVRKLKHLTTSFEGGTSVRAAAYPAEDGEKGVLSLSAVFGGNFNPHANKTVDDDELGRVSCPVRGGSLLVSRCNTSEWVGLPAYVDIDYPNLYLPDKLWQIDCGSPGFNRFIWYALQSKYAREYCAVMSVGSSDSMQNIASTDLLNMYIALPADQRARNTIVAFLDDKCARIDTLLVAKREQIDILKKRRQSLIYEYVTGKRRVGEEV